MHWISFDVKTIAVTKNFTFQKCNIFKYAKLLFCSKFYEPYMFCFCFHVLHFFQGRVCQLCMQHNKIYFLCFEIDTGLMFTNSHVTCKLTTWSGHLLSNKGFILLHSVQMTILFKFMWVGIRLCRIALKEVQRFRKMLWIWRFTMSHWQSY